MSDMPKPPTFMELYNRGDVAADDIDDFIDRWHEAASAGGHAIPLNEFLGLTHAEYEARVHDGSVLPDVARARLSHISIWSMNNASGRVARGPTIGRCSPTVGLPGILGTSTVKAHSRPPLWPAVRQDRPRYNR